MAAGPRVHTERNRAESFGGVAESYDRYRPSYPSALIDDLAATAPAAVLDIGCGTGKATRLLIERGLNVLGVEADARMAQVARQNGVQVEVATFEAWDSRGRTFDLLTAAQSWHWVDPAVGVAKAAELLRPNGVLALFWNHSIWVRPTKADFEAVYRTYAPDLLARAEQQAAHLDEHRFFNDVRASGAFTQTDERNYARTLTYSADDYVSMVNTYSDHIALPSTARSSLSKALRHMIAAAGGEVALVTRTYVVRAIR